MAEKKIPEKKPEEKPKKIADEAADDILDELEGKPKKKAVPAEKPTKEKKATTPLNVLSEDLAKLKVESTPESGSIPAKEGEEVEEKPKEEAKPEAEEEVTVVGVEEEAVEPEEKIAVEVVDESKITEANADSLIEDLRTKYQEIEENIIEKATPEKYKELEQEARKLAKRLDAIGLLTDERDSKLTDIFTGSEIEEVKAEEKEDRARIKKLEDAITGEKLKTQSYVADDVGTLIFFKDGKLFYETDTEPKEITPVFKKDGKTMDYFTVNGYKLEPKDAAAANTLAGYLKAQATDRKKIKKTAEIPTEDAESDISYETPDFSHYLPLRKAKGEKAEKLLAENLIHLYQFKKTASEAAYTAATDAFAKAIKKNEDLQNLSDEQLEDILTTEGAHWIDRPAIMRVYDNVQEAETPEKPTKLSEEE